MRSLELFWTHAAHVAVAACPVVELLDVLSNIDDSDRAVRVNALLDTLFLQAAEERLRHGVVPTVPSSAHAGLKARRRRRASSWARLETG